MTTGTILFFTDALNENVLSHVPDTCSFDTILIIIYALRMDGRTQKLLAIWLPRSKRDMSVGSRLQVHQLASVSIPY